MKRFLITLTFIASAIGAIEASKALWSWRSALKEVDQLYVVSTNQHAVCLGASCIGCSIVGDRFKSLWVPSSFEGISVRAPLARLMELERRGQLKGVSYCIMESCLFSYVTKRDLMADNMTASMWLQELPVNWRYWDLFPLTSSIYWRSLGRLLREAAARQWNFGFKICGHVKDDRLPFLQRDGEWRRERIEFYARRDFGDYTSKCDALDIRIREMKQVNAFCREHGLKFVIVFPPMSSFYLQSAPNEVLAQKNKLITALKADGVLVFDRLRGYPDELFFDPAHLTWKGAEAFTKDLETFIDADLKN